MLPAASLGAKQPTLFLYAGPTTVLALLCAFMIVGLVLAPATPLGRLLGWGPIVWIGKLSYSLYLYNYLAILLFPHSAVGEVVALSALACASYYLIERPGLMVKRRFEVSRRGLEAKPQQPEPAP